MKVRQRNRFNKPANMFLCHRSLSKRYAASTYLPDYHIFKQLRFYSSTIIIYFSAGLSLQRKVIIFNRATSLDV